MTTANRYNRDDIKVGDGVTLIMYSDNQAYTVIARTKTTLTIQRDKATLDPNFKPEGTPGCCPNNSKQSYSYEADEKGLVIKAYWSEKRHCFVDNKMPIVQGRREFYDYNF